MTDDATRLDRRQFLTATATGMVAVGTSSTLPAADEPNAPTGVTPLSADHLAAVHRRRRVVVNFDAIHGDPAFTDVDVERLAKLSLTFADDPGSHIDSIWWNWCEGNQVPYPSKRLPLLDHPGYRRWVDEGVDVVDAFLQATRKRGLEAFYSHRMNGSDNDLGPVPKIPMKERHPEWLIHTPWGKNGYWNFAVPEVRQHCWGTCARSLRTTNLTGWSWTSPEALCCPPAGNGRIGLP